MNRSAIDPYPCTSGGQLRLLYLWAAPAQRDERKAAWQDHLYHCPTCRAYFEQRRLQAMKARHPKLEEA